MKLKQNISVLIVDQTLDEKGIISNASFVLGLTAGRLMEQETFGQDVIDGDGNLHRFLTNIAHFVRKSGQSKLKNLRKVLCSNPEVIIVDYPEDAAPSDYHEYASNLAKHAEAEINYRAIHFYGPSETLFPLTKNLSRL